LELTESDAKVEVEIGDAKLLVRAGMVVTAPAGELLIEITPLTDARLLGVITKVLVIWEARVFGKLFGTLAVIYSVKVTKTTLSDILMVVRVEP
jgi:hypothetical protein